MKNEERMHKLKNGSDTAIWAHNEIISLREQLAQAQELLAQTQEDLSIAIATSSELFRLREHAARNESKMIKQRIMWRHSLRKQRNRAKKAEQQLAQNKEQLAKRDLENTRKGFG